MARLSKLDRMSFIEQEVAEIDIETVRDQLTEMSEAAEKALEAKGMVEEAAAEAQGYHEEREWESRDDSLSTISDQLSELGEALDVLESFTPDLIAQLRDQLDDARKHQGEAQEQIDHLV